MTPVQVQTMAGIHAESRGGPRAQRFENHQPTTNAAADLFALSAMTAR